MSYLTSEERIKAIVELNIMGTPPEKEYDEITALATRLCNVPKAAITVLDNERQWFKSRVGIDLNEISFEQSICKLGIEATSFFEIEDTWKDERLANNSITKGIDGVRFYAGVPLIAPSGYVVGMLCIMDTKPNKLTPEQKDSLHIFGEIIVKHFALRLALKEVEHKKQELESLLLFKEKMFGIISHDLRAPIANIRQILNLYKTGNITADEFMVFVDALEVQLQGTESILTNLMAWSKTQAPIIKNTKPSELIKQSIHELATEIEKKQLTVETKIDNDESINIDMDGFLIVLRNILNNAIKFSFPSKTIEIHTNIVGNKLHVDVKDYGKGLSEKNKDRVINSNETFTTLGTMDEKGTGLGLTVCKYIVAQNGGKITMESEENKGTTVSFTFQTK